MQPKAGYPTFPLMKMVLLMARRLVVRGLPLIPVLVGLLLGTVWARTSAGTDSEAVPTPESVLGFKVGDEGSIHF